MIGESRPFKLRALLAIAVMFAGLSVTAGDTHAVQPDEILKDLKLEKRARSLSAELRCLVCQNQSIDDSNAPLARDLRLLVRERLQKGDSDTEVMQFIVARYGEFVLLKPTFGLHNLLLWLTPILGLLGGGLLALRYIKRGDGGVPAGEAALSPEERARLDKLLESREP